MAGRWRHPEVPDGCPLTTMQFRVVRDLTEGLAIKQIGQRHGIVPSTVRTHLYAAYRHLNVTNAAQAVAAAYHAGWLHAPPRGGPQAPQTPLSPFLRAYLTEFDRWLDSGFRDCRAREGMTLALHGALNERSGSQAADQRPRTGDAAPHTPPRSRAARPRSRTLDPVARIAAAVASAGAGR